jgi:predicted RNase H-like nuclease (RuvC/YqgF family)
MTDIHKSVINTFQNSAATGIDDFEKLRVENEQLRAIFETANEEFIRLNRRVSLQEEELRSERQKNRILEEANRSLKLKLGQSEAVTKKLSSMLFGLKSEKLKIADIDIKTPLFLKVKKL